MTTFKELPAEVIVLIAEYVVVAKGSLAPLAATCRQYQPHVESLIWRSLRIGDSELADFVRFVTPSRFLLIRRLAYHIGLTPTDQQSRTSAARITSDQADAYNLHFTEAVRSILTALRDKDAAASADHPGLCLSLAGSCDLGSGYLASHPGQGRDRAWIKLLQDHIPDDLSVPAVISFENYGLPFDTLSQSVWLPSWASILAHCPNIVIIEVQVSDGERKNLSNRKYARDGKLKAFGESLATLPPQLINLTLTYSSYPPHNQFNDPPLLTSQPQGFDIFSHQLGILAARQVKLDVRGTTMDLVDFFRSCSLNGCPHLEKLRLLDQQAASADGTWYFVLDPRMIMEEFVEDHLDPDAQTIDELHERMTDDELPASMDVPNNSFRTSTDPAKFREVYLAAADAVRRMPKLRVFEIWVDLQGESAFGRGEHELRYTRGRDRWCSSSKADINVGWGLIPMIDIDADVLEAWRSVGQESGEFVQLFTREDNLDYDAFAPIHA